MSDAERLKNLANLSKTPWPEGEVLRYISSLSTIGRSKEFEDGFISGAKAMVDLHRQAILVLLDVAASDNLDRDELIATLKLWCGVQETPNHNAKHRL